MQSKVLSCGKQQVPCGTFGHRLCLGLTRTSSSVLGLVLASLVLGLIPQIRLFAAAGSPAGDVSLSAEALASIQALQGEKAARSPLLRKLDSQLVYALRERAGINANGAHPHHRARVRTAANGQLLVDIRGDVTPELLATLRAEGGVIIRALPEFRAIRARLSLNAIERLASRPEIERLRPAVEAITNAGSVESEGGITHGATAFRNKYRVDGTGLKVGVLSDSLDFLSEVTASGNLPTVHVLPGQEGSGSGEGTAMLEIVHDLAPGAELHFATAFAGEASFAQNIRDLFAAGCRIIVDDITYFDESPFQDGVISKAVRDVCAGGALYFSSAGNSGNKSDNSAGTWEGDFVDGGVATQGRGGRLHSFGAGTFNTVLSGGGFRRLDLFWSDPLGKSTNDYDVYVLNNLGQVIASSTNIQDGNDDPYESIGSLNIGDRIVIVKQKGADRYLHLSTGRARLAVSTGGNVRGHNAASAENAFSVAATWVGASPALYTPATVNQVEVFSSDGPRRMFYDADGTPFTPGNFSSSGGTVLNKPDITAADGVATATPDFRPFFGTSAAAPHAAAIAALVWSYNPSLSPTQVRQALLSTALDIETPGLDSSSGYGVVMPEPAVAAVTQPAPRLWLDKIQLVDANGNGHLDANECGELTFELRNLLALTGSSVTGVTAFLSTVDSQLVIDPAPREFQDIAPQARGTNLLPFRVSTKDFPSCDRPLLLQLHVSGQGMQPQVFPFQLETQSPGSTPPFIRSAPNLPIPIADLTETVSVMPVSDIPAPIARVELEVHLLHTYLSDLVLELSGPDGTGVLLAANQGGSGSNYGLSCEQPTRFSDEAVSRLGSSSPPFAGTFRAEALLSAFRGKTGSQVNGNWKLKIRDTAEYDVGTLVCWSLDFRLVSCEQGGGRCLVAPTITSQPVDLQKVLGDPAVFSVTAQGTEPLSYQWFKGTDPIPGATANQLTLTSVSQADSAGYFVTISNPYGTVDSRVALLDVVTLPSITQQPLSKTIPLGDTATLSVGSSGTGPLSYQWFHGENSVPGQTNATLVIPGFGAADAGSYRVEVSSPFGQVLSDVAILTIVLPPTITLMPADLVVTNGDPALFQVQVTGTPPLTFFWIKDSSEWFPEAVDGSLTLPVTTLGDAGLYSVVVSNLAGVVSSRQARLDVFQAPQFVISPTNQLVALHGNLSLVSLATGVPAPSYRWYRSTLEGFEIIPDATNAQFVISSAEVSDARRYQVTASNLLGVVVSGEAEIQVLPLPLITSQPQSQKVVAGSTVNFQVQVSGDGPFSYQWFFNGSNPLLGRTQSQLTLVGVGPEAQGAYHVVISNQVGAVASLPATLQLGSPVVILTQPSAKDVAVGGAAALQVEVTGDAPLTFQWLFNATNQLKDATNSILQLENLSFEGTGDYQVVIENFAGSVTSQVARVEVLQPPHIVTDPIAQSVNLGGAIDLAVSADGALPLVYRWYFNENFLIAGADGPVLHLEALGADVEGFYTVEVSNRVGTVRSTPAFVQVITPPKISGIAGQTTVPLGGHLTLEATVEGTAPFGFEWFHGDDVIPGQTAAVLVLQTLQFSDSGSYRVKVSNAAGVATSDPVEVSVLEAPIITVPPQPQLLAVGQELLLNAVVTGSEPLTFWWIYNTNQVLVGEHNPSLLIPSIQLNQAGTYQLVVSNAVGKAFSSHVNVRVEEPPTFVLEPEDLSLPRGSLAHLTVIAAGSPPLRYQWMLQAGDLIADATNATLVLSNVSSNNAGGYRVMVANDVGSITSRVAVLTVKEVPLIVSQPTPQTVVEGETATFSVTALSPGELHYQWFFNGIFSLSDQTNATLVFPNATTALEGDYSVEVSNAEGSVLSSRARLRVIVPPSFLSEPEDATVGVGDKAAFDVEAGGSLPIHFQWFTENLTLIPDATNASVEVGPLALTDSGGGYFVVASNLGGSLTSRVAHVTVLEPPSFVVQPQSLAVVLGGAAEFTASAQGDAPLFYQWFGPNNQTIPGAEEANYKIPSVQPSDEGFYFVQVSNQVGRVTSLKAKLNIIFPPLVTLLSPSEVLVGVGGSTTLQAQASGSLPFTYQWVYFVTNLLEDATNASLSLNGLAETNSGAYQLVVSNPAGSVTSSVVNVQVVLPPSIQKQPQSIEVAEGSTAEFKVGASGFEPLSYQWLGPDELPIPGATGSVLSLTKVSTSQAGLYSVIVSNAVGFVTSEPASLSIALPPQFVLQPLSQNIAEGGTVTFQVEVTGTEPIGLQWYYEGTKILSDETGNVLALEKVSVDRTGNYSVQASNIAGVVWSSAAHLAVLAAPAIIKHPQPITVNQGSSAVFEVTASGAEPLEYQWFGPDALPLPGANASVLQLSLVQSAQAGPYHVRVRNPVGEVFSESGELTVVVPPSIDVPPVSQLAARGGSVTFLVKASGSEPLSYQWFFQATNAVADATNATVTIEKLRPDQSGPYSVSVSNAAGFVVSSEAILQVVEPPAIVQQPTSIQVIAGQTARFEVVATGEGPLSYLWVGPDLLPVAGGTSAVLEIPSVSAANSGIYRVEVRNAVGTVTSDKAQLDVVSPPVFVLEPVDAAFARGSQASIEVEALGSNPLHYQWFKESTNALAGETNRLLRWKAVDYEHAGFYSVIVSNAFGAITSRLAHIEVLEAPAIFGISSDLTVIAGANAAFEIDLIGDEPLTFQWYRNGDQPVPGGKGRRLELKSVSVADAGIYTVRVENPVGSAESKPALLEVLVPPFVILPPRSTTVPVGATAELQVLAGGTEPITYQWMRNGSEKLAGETNPVLSFAAAQLSHTGAYSVILSNIAGTFTSSDAQLRVLELPVILRSPVSTTVPTGAVVRLDVEVGGSGPFTYQWRTDGGVAIPGASSPTLTLQSVQETDSGRFFVEVANEVGVVNSAAATLLVLEPPSLLSEPQDRTVASGTRVEFLAGVRGAPELSIQWYRFDTNPIPGATTNPLVLPTVSIADSGSYTLTVSNLVGGVVSRSIFLTVLDAPIIDAVPKAVTVAQGEEARFDVDARGSSLTYQWFRDGTSPIPGATNRSLIIPHATLASAANYSVTVSNKVGTASSPQAALRVLVPAEILSFSYDGSVAAVSFFSLKNLRYTLENTDNIGASGWRISSGSLLRKGTDGVITLYDLPGEDSAHRFYRIRVE